MMVFAMLIGVGQVVVGAFYILTALWIVLLGLLYTRREGAASRLAFWMTGIATIEGFAALNAAAGAVVTVFNVGLSRSTARTAIALIYAVIQVVCLYSLAKTRDQKA